MGAVGVAWLGVLRAFVLANSSPVPDDARSRSLLTNVSLAAQWSLATLFGLAAVPREGPGLVVAGAGLALVSVPAALVATYVGSPPPVPDDRPAPPEGGWLFVPRRNGAGLGIVRHHPRFWLAVALVAAGPLLFIAVGWLA
jgi:hypothetical protein